jgi:hypothetical protein
VCSWVRKRSPTSLAVANYWAPSAFIVLAVNYWAPSTFLMLATNNWALFNEIGNICLNLCSPFDVSPTHPDLHITHNSYFYKMRSTSNKMLLANVLSFCWDTSKHYNRQFLSYLFSWVTVFDVLDNKKDLFYQGFE